MYLENEFIISRKEELKMAKFIQFMTKESLYDGPFDSGSGWPAAGMGDVIVTESGKLIVIDGGTPENAEEFLKLLSAQTSAQIPEIEYWIITHPHIDHYGVIQELGNNADLNDRIKVKQFIYWFPEEFCGANGAPNALAGQTAKLQNVCKTFGAESHRPTRDEVVTVDDISIKFLFVPDDCSYLNRAGGNVNLCSLIFSVDGKSRRVLVTGDAYERSMLITAWRYTEELKADILQMPHHALCDSHCVEFYRYVDPTTVLMPISKAGYRAMHSKLYDRDQGCIANLCLEAKAETVIKAYEGTAELFI